VVTARTHQDFSRSLCRLRSLLAVRASLNTTTTWPVSYCRSPSSLKYWPNDYLYVHLSISTSCSTFSCCQLLMYKLFQIFIQQFLLWHCRLGDRKGIRFVKMLGVVFWWWRFDWSFTPLNSSSCHHHLHHPIKSRMATFWCRLTWIVLETVR